ncbi:MAG: hypothetical protein ACE5IB_05360 [Candidatus Geothermarchaeales archaeon]
MGGRSGRRRRRLGGAIDTIAFGGILMIVGYIWFTHPRVFSDLWETFMRLVEDQVLQPSQALVVAAYTFLFLVAVRNVLLGAMRAAGGQSNRSVLREFFRAVAYVGIGYFIFQYSGEVLTGSLLVLYSFLTAGILVVIYGAMAYAVEKRAPSAS